MSVIERMNARRDARPKPVPHQVPKIQEWDWSLLVLKLKKHCAPMEQISLLCGRHKQWARKLAAGELREPWHSDGMKLLHLATKYVPDNELRECRR